jgi:hypothetical protein
MTTYPVFEAGQTLTKADLNVLRDFLDAQDLLLGRLAGFGIACGLTGELKGGVLAISSGLAVDQEGHPMMLDPGVEFPDGAAGVEEFTFLDRDRGGVTPVLVVRDTLQPAPLCNAAGCAAHAATRSRTVEVVLGIGRLRDAEDDWALEPLLDAIPLGVGSNSAVQGGFATLRDLIVRRWRATGIDTELTAVQVNRVAALRADSTTPAVNVYRAAFLNQVLFATIELLRCRTLHAGTCLRVEGTPGVALGWLSQAGGVATWDCRYRHAFEPNDGVVMALLGGGCADPCDLFLDQLKALLDGFNEPVPPPAGGGGGGVFPPLHVCPRKTDIWLYGKCVDIHVPPLVRKPDIRDLWGPKKKPFVDKRDWVKQLTLEEIYGQPLDFLKAGTLVLTETVGRPGALAEEKVKETLTGQGVGTPDVRVLPQDEVAGLPGFEPQAMVGVGDTVVLVTNAAGTVVSTGRIAAAKTLEGIGPAIGGAAAAAAEAVTAAERATELVAKVETDLAGVETKLTTSFDAKIEALDTKTTERFERLVFSGGVTGGKFEVPGGGTREIDLALTSIVEAVKEAAPQRKRREVTEKLAEGAEALAVIKESAAGGRGVSSTTLKNALGAVLGAVASAGATPERIAEVTEILNRFEGQ